jgi:uncharacterized protein YggE
MAPLVINVSGTSNISRRAERAVVSIYVSASGPDQSTVTANVTQTANGLQKDLKELSSTESAPGTSARVPPITHWSMSSLATGSYLVWLQERNADGSAKSERTYSANTSFEIKFRDFAMLSAVCTDLASIPRVAIRSVHWRLTDETRSSLVGDSRRLAVENAVSKARDFAAAVGRSHIVPVEINTVGDEYPRPAAMFGAPAVRSRAALGAQHAEDDRLNFEPEEVNLSCSVNMKFEAE